MAPVFQASLAIIYWLSALSFFAYWLTFFNREASRLSSKQRSLCLATLAIASILWPITVPIAYLEQVSKTQQTVH